MGSVANRDFYVREMDSRFWIGAKMQRDRFMETVDADAMPILTRLEEAGATLTGLRLFNGVTVLRIARQQGGAGGA